MEGLADNKKQNKEMGKFLSIFIKITLITFVTIVILPYAMVYGAIKFYINWIPTFVYSIFK